MVTNFSRMPLRICSTASPITSPRRESSDWALPTSSKSIIVCSALADGRDGLRCEAKVKVVSDWPTLLCDNRRSGGQLPQPWRAPRKSLWQASVEGSVRSAPILYDGLLYVSSLAGFLNALDTGTGKVRWRFKTTAPIHSTPSLNSGQVLVSCDGGTLYAIDSSSGTKTWDVPAGGEVWTSAIVSRSEEHTSELQSPIDISYAVFCLKKKKKTKKNKKTNTKTKKKKKNK